MTPPQFAYFNRFAVKAVKMGDKTNVIIFNGENHTEWETSVTFHIKAKGLGKVLTKARPMDAAEASKWDDLNDQAFGKIGERIDPKYHEFLLDLTTAKEAMDKMKEIAEANDTNLLIRTRRQFANASLRDGDDLYEYLATMERYRRVLKSTSAPIGDQELVIRIMESLPDSWDAYFQALRTQSSIIKK